MKIKGSHCSSPKHKSWELHSKSCPSVYLYANISDKYRHVNIVSDYKIDEFIYMYWEVVLWAWIYWGGIEASDDFSRRFVWIFNIEAVDFCKS